MCIIYDLTKLFAPVKKQRKVLIMQGSQGQDTVLRFLQDMPIKGTGFFRDILSLFEKHFGVSTSLVITYVQTGAAVHNKQPKYKYIVRNLDPNQIRLYFSEYHKTDVFVARRRKLKTVAALSELATQEELDALPYYHYLNALGIWHQACLFLRDDKRLLATISLFRSREAGDFTAGELEMLRTIEPFITRQYRQFMAMNWDASPINRFDEYFADLDMGVAILDRDRRILKANSVFSDYAAYILEHGTIEDSIVTRETVDIPSDYVSAQKLLNYFGAPVVTKPHRIHIECMLYLYRFQTKAIYAQGASGINELEQMYLVFLIRQEKIRSQEMLDALKILTPREMSVLGYLASGLSNAEIADAMKVSPFTVKTHLQNIYSKCNVSARNELLAKLH